MAGINISFMLVQMLDLQSGSYRLCDVYFYLQSPSTLTCLFDVNYATRLNRTHSSYYVCWNDEIMRSLRSSKDHICNEFNLKNLYLSSNLPKYGIFLQVILASWLDNAFCRCSATMIRPSTTSFVSRSGCWMRSGLPSMPHIWNST